MKRPFWERQAAWYRERLLRISQATALDGHELRIAAKTGLQDGKVREVRNAD